MYLSTYLSLYLSMQLSMYLSIYLSTYFCRNIEWVQETADVEPIGGVCKLGDVETLRGVGRANHGQRRIHAQSEQHPPAGMCWKVQRIGRTQ